jgi:hypothetical protein
MNTGTGAAARAATFLSRIVQNQKINHLETCMENRKILSSTEFRNARRKFIYIVANERENII